MKVVNQTGMRWALAFSCLSLCCAAWAQTACGDGRTEVFYMGNGSTAQYPTPQATCNPAEMQSVIQGLKHAYPANAGDSAGSALMLYYAPNGPLQINLEGKVGACGFTRPGMTGMGYVFRKACPPPPPSNSGQ